MRAGRQPLPAADGRPRQRRHHGSGRTRRATPASCGPAASRRPRSASGPTSTSTCSAELADAGGGHFYYIVGPPQIRDAITSEVGETLEIVARDVALEVLAREGIDVEAITPHKVSRAAAGRSSSLGDLGSEQFVEVVLRLTFPFGSIGQEAGAIFSVTDRDGVFAERLGRRPGLSWDYADDVHERPPAARP